MAIPDCTDLILHAATRVLEAHFADGGVFHLPAELLRVYSPSAEVRGHGPGQEVLVSGKRAVAIKAVDEVGNYGVLLRFSDGHESGIFGFDYLHHLGTNQDALWEQYEGRLQAAGKTRDA